MSQTPRGRFILAITVSYALLALAWIFLSDHLLGLFTDVDSIVWLSTAKGVFFVLATSALLFVALRTVPPANVRRTQSVLSTMAEGPEQEQRPSWLIYAFAVLLPLAMLVMQLGMGVGEQTMLILHMLPIILSAMLGGLWPGLVATAVAALGVGYWALPPVNHWRISSSVDLLQWALLILNGMAVSFLSEVLRRSQAKAEASRRLLDAVVSGTSDCVFVKDLDGRYLMANTAVAQLTGQAPDSIVGRDDQALFPLPVAQLLKAIDHAIVAGGKTQTHEENLTMPDGQPRVFLSTKGPVFDALGQVKGVFGIARDITGRKNIEAALQASEAAMQAAQHLAGVGSWEWDLESGVHTWSPEVYRIYGRSQELPPAVYPDVQQYFMPDSWSCLAAATEASLTTGQAYKCDAEVVRPDGSHRWIVVRGEVTRAPDGRITRLYGSVHDITERKLMSLQVQANEERLRLAIDAISEGLWDWDATSKRVYRSPQYYALLGACAEEDDGSFAFFQKSVYPEDLPTVMRHIEAHQLGDTEGMDFECRIVARSGALKWVRVRGRVVLRDAAGESLRMVGTIADIEERKVAEALLLEREQRLARVIEGSDQGYWDWNLQTNAMDISARCDTMLGYEPGERNVSIENWETLIHPDDLPPAMASIERHIHGESFTHQIEYRMRTKAGGWLWILSRGRVVSRSADGRSLMMSGTHTDISQFKVHQAELDHMAHYDHLTGTPNRRLLSDRLDQAILHAGRTGKSLAVSFLDLDGFKAINDQYGHVAGDQLLIGVSENLKHVLRGDDTLARLGGDEFVLLLADIESPEECSQVLERVLQAAALPVVVDSQRFSVSASIGVSLYPQDHSDADTLLRHADQAMYIAKEAGKNRYHLFDPESDRKAQVHRQHLEVLRLALQRHEFVLYYQPKVDLRSGEVFGAEALIRWRHPERGLLAPVDFLPYINGSDLEIPLGNWVIQNALAQAAQWHTCGLPITVSANVSAHHLLHPDFYDRLRATLAQFPQVPPSSFELEVLETAALNDVDQAIDILNRCRELGVHFALDDFGTGYSSLTYLRKLPVDMLKIDQSFVRDMLSDPEDQDIVEGVIRLAAAFHRPVIAEGVETLAHGAALLQLGCSLAQGYGIARPMPAEQLVGWVDQWQASGAWRNLQSYALDNDVVSDTLHTT